LPTETRNIFSLFDSSYVRLGDYPIFACPGCHSLLEKRSEKLLYCCQEGISFEKEHNIWKFISPERSRHFEKFIEDYEKIRNAEGRGSDDPTYYQELPFKDLTGRFVEDWRIRTVSYLALVKQVLTPFNQSLGRPLRILDIGAGNGWLSHRLTQLGQRVVALDLLTNSFDGLGACVHYPDPFVVVQAEFDRLPFAQDLFDMVIFNAALHYSENYHTTLNETLRVLDQNSRLVIIDSPIYRNPKSGEQMVQEREDYFSQNFGFPSDALKSENYLTFQRLVELEEQFDLRWQYIKPNYGWKWRLKPWVAKLTGRREPAQFLILVGHKN
jgi:ubiquinone/menaquinone biosynthesis C-methylase UbiE